MNIAKIKYRLEDNRVIVVETKPLVNDCKILNQVKSNGKLVVFKEERGCYTLFIRYPMINELIIGSKVSVIFEEKSCEDCERVTISELEQYLEKYCPVYVKRTYNKSTKVHTIVFTDKRREE